MYIYVTNYLFGDHKTYYIESLSDNDNYFPENIYICTPLIHKPWTIFIVVNWCEILDEKYEWLNNCLWLTLFGCG